METSATAIALYRQSDKENIPPVCNNTKGKNPILHTAPSNVKNNKTGGNKRKHKRIPLADITALFNNSVSVTFALAQEQQNGVSSLPSANSPRRTPMVPGSKTLRMGFR